MVIQECIDGFQPAWIPEKGSLQGLSVVLHPTGGGAEEAGQRRRDDFNWRTAGHLYHLVKRGGGRAILTRMDDRPMATDGLDVNDALTTRCRDARAHVILLLGGTATAQKPVASSEPDALSAALAKTLAGTIDKRATAQPAPLAEGVPGAAFIPADSDLNADPAQHALLARTYAQQLCKGLVAFARDHRADLRTRRNMAPPGPESDKPDSDDENEDARHDPRLRRLARSIWPNGPLPPDKARWFSDVFCRLTLIRMSAAYYAPEIRLDGDAVVIGGATSIPAMMETLETMLRAVGIANVRTEMRLLPDRDRLGDSLFGVCRAAMALTLERPADSAGQQTQLLFGEPVFLLDRDRGFLLVQAGDGYWGWVREESIERMDQAQFTAYCSPLRATLLDDINRNGLRVPRGACLPIAEQDSAHVTLAGPEGRRIQVATAGVSIIDRRTQLESRAKTALAMLHTPYVFGGRSPIGLDCSGLITNVCEQEGVPMARDAAQQVLGGKIVATRWYRDNIRAGDRVYFIDRTGKVSHTGIAISATHFVHSSPPEVQISSLKQGDRLYAQHWDEAFLCAMRP